MFQFETYSGMKNARISVTEKNRKFHFHIFSLAFFPETIKSILATGDLKPIKFVRARIRMKPTDSLRAIRKLKPIIRMRAMIQLKPTENMRFNLARVKGPFIRSIN